MADDDDGEFAYFLPKGIEDDADDGGFGGGSFSSNSSGRYELDDGGSTGSNEDTLHSLDDPTSAYSFGGTTSRIGLSAGNWQSQSAQTQSATGATAASTQTTQQQQAALISSVLQQRQQQSQIQYGSNTNNNSAAEALLAAFYSQQNNNSSNYYNPSTSPSHSTSHSIGATSSSGGVGYPNASPSPSLESSSNSQFTSQQAQFFHQLQIYQQQLLQQTQLGGSSGAAGGSSTYGSDTYTGYGGGGGGGHYTKAPPGLTYDNESIPLRTLSDDKPTQSLNDAVPIDRSRRRPLPHHSHTNVTIMNRPPTDEPVVHQPKTTVVTSSATVHSNPSAVLSSSSWGAGHSTQQNSTTDSSNSSSHGKSSYVKHIPSSVVASTKKEVWPKVTTVKTVKSTEEQKTATALPAASTTPEKKSATVTVSPVVAKPVSTSVKTTTVSTTIPPKRVGPPVATIRHIESDEPVPLTAAEMASLNAHHRKAGNLIQSNSTGVTEVTPTKSDGSSTSSTTMTHVKRVREHRHDHHPKFIPGPTPLPNDNVFDFLGETDPDFIPSDSESRTSKKKGKKQQNQPTSSSTPSDDEEVEDTKPTDEDEGEEVMEEDQSFLELNGADEEIPVDAEDEVVEGGEDEIDSVEMTQIDSPSTSSSPPSRIASPQAISPTTGLPIPPILRQASGTSGHSRRVSFQQPPTKKQLAAQKAREQPWLTNNTAWKEGGNGANNGVQAAPTDTTEGVVDDSTTQSTSTAYPVETVTGLKKRKDKKDKKGKSTPSVTSGNNPKNAEPDADEVDEPVPIVEPSKSVAPVKSGTFMTFLSSFMAQYVTTRSRSLSARVSTLTQYLLGVFAGLVWSFICMVARIHKQAAYVINTDHAIAMSFGFIYLFPYLVNHMIFWAPPWSIPLIWYGFLMYTVCTKGAPLLVAIFRILIPLIFLTEGVSHHTILLELNGSERLVVASVLCSFKTQEFYRPVFLLALAFQIVTSLVYGSHILTQWSLFILSLMVMHERETSNSSMTASGATNPTAKNKLAASPPTNSNEAQVNGPIDPAAQTSGLPTGASSAPAPPAGGNWFSNLFGSGGVSGLKRARAKTTLAQKSKMMRPGGRF